MQLVTIDDVRATAARISDLVLRTPLLDSERLSSELGARVLVKAENLQHTGSFKVRGAGNALLRLRERDELPAGVVCYSAGNHGAAVAYAGRQLGVRAVVAMPTDAQQAKLDNVRRYGGEVVQTDDFAATCDALAADRGWPTLLPFDDPDVIAGQGTAGLEICADGFTPDLVLVPVGGGGLLAGIATAVKTVAPSARVVGVEPGASNAMSEALRAGMVVPLPSREDTVADSLTAPYAGKHTLPQVSAYADDVVEVPEDAITDAWHGMVEATRLVVEPAGAVGLAALRCGAVRVPDNGSVVLVASGGN